MGGFTVRNDGSVDSSAHDAMEQGVALRMQIKQYFGASFRDNRLPVDFRDDVNALAALPAVKAMGFPRFVDTYVLGSSGLTFAITAEGFRGIGEVLGKSAKEDAAANRSDAATRTYKSLLSNLDPASEQADALRGGFAASRDLQNGRAPVRPTAPSAAPALNRGLAAPTAGGIDVRTRETEAPSVPFNGNAADQWYPAIREASAYAQKLGLGTLRSEGTGDRVRSITIEPNVNAIEIQRLILVAPNGSERELGRVLPEKKHLGSLRSTQELTSIFESLIDSAR